MNFKGKGIGDMMKNKLLVYALGDQPCASFRSSFFRRLLSDRADMFKTAQIGDEEFDPAKWGEVYPLQYESWLKTKEPRPKDKSFYKRGWDTTKPYGTSSRNFPSWRSSSTDGDSV